MRFAVLVVVQELDKTSAVDMKRWVRVSEMMYIYRFIVTYSARIRATAEDPEGRSAMFLAVSLLRHSPCHRHHLLRVSYDVMVSSLEDALSVRR